MPLIECLVAMQQGMGGNSPRAISILVALVAFVLGGVVWVFVRTSAKRSSKTN